MGRVCTCVNLFTQTMKDKGYTLHDLERLTKIVDTDVIDKDTKAW